MKCVSVAEGHGVSARVFSWERLNMGKNTSTKTEAEVRGNLWGLLRSTAFLNHTTVKETKRANG